MPKTSPSLLSDRELLDTTLRVAGDERRTTAELLALLAELDSRKLYLGEGSSSLFTYCTQALRLSEPEAYARITAARAAGRFPLILKLLTEGDVTLTTITLLAPHLTGENQEALLDGARHKSKRDVERMVACLHPQPDVSSTVRKLPARNGDPVRPASTVPEARPPEATRTEPMDADTRTDAPVIPRAGIPKQAETRLLPQSMPSRPVVAPLSQSRYVIKVTISGETHAKLERAQSLLRHVIPDGDVAAVLDRALTLLVANLERTRLAATTRPARVGRPQTARTTRSRHVPAAVKRAVWERDGSRCAFVGRQGRCRETGFLELHHVVPYADGGSTSVANLQLRCRSHNALEAAQLVWRSRGTMKSGSGAVDCNAEWRRG